uniref:Uncharacterized protein n=1 Tax=Candidatus Nitrotoga fabula TaxID=2182327 RepID=A0A2X0SFR7_9PROT|nr:protein of unknown function [Candidatus Nitrotoga fabula]
MSTYATLTDRTRKIRRMVIPSTEDLEKHGMSERLSREKFASTQEWLTACYFEFANKVQK